MTNRDEQAGDRPHDAHDRLQHVRAIVVTYTFREPEYHHVRWVLTSAPSIDGVVEALDEMPVDSRRVVHGVRDTKWAELRFITDTGSQIVAHAHPAVLRVYANGYLPLQGDIWDVLQTVAPAR